MGIAVMLLSAFIWLAVIGVLIAAIAVILTAPRDAKPKPQRRAPQPVVRAPQKPVASRTPSPDYYLRRWVYQPQAKERDHAKVR